MSRRVLIGLGLLALVILAAGGGYFYGISVGEARASQARQQLARGRFMGQGNQTRSPGQTPQPGQQGGTRSGGGITGTIEAIEGDTLVVNTQEGSLRVKTTDTTLIEKFTSVGVEELRTGEQVMITGSKNDDGSVTARSIQSLRAFQAPQADQP
jgi:hypothetical protein